MLNGGEEPESDREITEKKQAAVSLLDEAWDVADSSGIDPEIMSQAALFSALATLVTIYGEMPVAQLIEKIPDRIRCGDYTLHQIMQ